MSRLKAHVFLHLPLLFAAQVSQPLRSLPESLTQIGSRQLPLCALLGDRRRRFQRQQRDGLLDAASAEVDLSEQFGNRKTRGCCLQRFEHAGWTSARVGKALSMK